MPVSDAQKRARAKYDAEHFVMMRIKPKIEEAERIRAHAEARGESLTRFLVRAAEIAMETDNNKDNDE